MLRILRDKFLRLGRDDDGVALVTTLAVFMFMYLFCMGVYAIGTAVKTRIHLQNACDAAAYSAAVVQADTLSRIATINRAMSWTYVQMTRRQMDGIVYKLMHETCNRYAADKARAIDIWYGTNPLCPIHGYEGWRNGWFIGSDRGDNYKNKIKINGYQHESFDTVRTAKNYFDSNYLNRYRTSFYSQSGHVDFTALCNQVTDDITTICQMNNAIDDLAAELYTRERTTVREILRSNLGFDCPFFVRASEDPRIEVSADEGFMEKLNSSEESRFFAYGGYFNNVFCPVRYKSFSESTPSDVFYAGYNTWFAPSGVTTGFKRIYRQQNRLLSTEWVWWADKWKCWEDEYAVWHHTCVTPPRYTEIPNGLEAERFRSELPMLYDGRANGYDVVAYPRKLKKEYFNRNGTITVAVAVVNRNPWASILGNAIQGLFSAFNIGRGVNIGGGVNPLHTVCIASAKAGYKYLGENEGNRKYRISWEDVNWNTPGQSWNLCQSDWDAVLIPVRRAETFAKGKGGDDAVWDDEVGDFLDGYLNGIASPNEMLAGGSGKGVDEIYAGRDLGEEYRFGTIGGDGTGVWRGANLPDYRSNNDVNMKWRIGNPNNPIKWDEIQKVMFH